MATRAAAKAITVLKRAECKKASTSYGVQAGDLIYLVKGDTGNVYVTTLRNDGHHSCTCKSTRKCYHIKGCEKANNARIEAVKVVTPEVIETPEQKEAREWVEYRQALARKLAAQFMTAQVVEQVAEQLAAPAKVVKLAKIIELPVQPAKTTDVSTHGNLNGQRGFSLMR